MPAVPDQTDGVSFPYPVTPNDPSAQSIKAEPVAQVQGQGLNTSHNWHSLSNFGMTPTVPQGPQGRYASYGQNDMHGTSEQPYNDMAYLSHTGVDGQQPSFPSQSSNAIPMVPSGVSYLASGPLPGHSASGDMGNHDTHVGGPNMSNPFGGHFIQYHNTNNNVQSSGQYTQQQQSQQAGGAAMGADFEVNNLGFPQLLDDWFGPAQEEDDTLEPLDLQDFWMKVGPGEVSFDVYTVRPSPSATSNGAERECKLTRQAQGGFPFR
jgi:hypothetical protein